MMQDDISTTAKGTGVSKSQRRNPLASCRPNASIRSRSLIRRRRLGLPRVTILMTDAGGGHRSAARSLAEALNGQAHVTILNLVDDYAPFPFNRLSPSYAPMVNRTPWLYRLVYKATEDRKFVIAAENACYPLVKKRISAPLLALAPDLVISVHPLLTDVPIRLLRKAGNRAPFVTVVTDPVTVHPAWFCPEVDLCVVATDIAYRSGLEAGMDPARLRVIGLPIRRAFSDDARPATPRRARPAWACSRIGPWCCFLAARPALVRCCLWRARSRGGWQKRRFPLRWRSSPGATKCSCDSCRLKPWPIKVVPLGFVDQMADWMRASDILVTKAGPGTLAEAVCVGTPVIVTDFIAGTRKR